LLTEPFGAVLIYLWRRYKSIFIDRTVRSGILLMAQDAVAAPPAFARAAEAPLAEPVKVKRSPRRFLLPLVALVALVAVGFGANYGNYYFTEGRFLVSTDDAYVGASMVIMSPKIAGYVVEVPVKNNQEVHAGDVLARIDGGDYQLAVEAAKAKVATQDATIARIGRQIEAQRATVAQAEAQVGSARATSESVAADQMRASLEFERSQKLAQTSFGSQQRLEQATADAKRTVAATSGAQSALASSQAQLAFAKANVDVMQSQRTEAERTRAELMNAVQRAERDLSFAEIRAPFDGVIGNKAVEIGQFAQPGQRLMAVVPLDKVFVDANFKETQLGPIKPGQKVEVSVDALGGQTIEGVVRSVAPASGSEFSLLPPDNATGNFTKIVQRVTVRIGFDAESIRAHVLRPGLSVVAVIRTRDETQPRPTLLGSLGLQGFTLERLRTRMAGALGLDKSHP
jgi:membrane fusion protein (multidrug efflux system)